MRFSLALLCVTSCAVLLPAAGACAQDDSYVVARAAARHDLWLAKTELRHYRQVEYPRLQRALDAEIQLTEREIRVYKERLHEYRPFDRFSVGRPLSITLQELRMCILDAELRLRDLWAERNALVRFHSDEWRLLEMKVHEARVRVAEIEAAHEARTGASIQTPAVVSREKMESAGANRQR